jgi:hypothetical protein
MTKEEMKLCVGQRTTSCRKLPVISDVFPERLLPVQVLPVDFVISILSDLHRMQKWSESRLPFPCQSMTYKAVGERFELVDGFVVPPLVQVAVLVVLASLVVKCAAEMDR